MSSADFKAFIQAEIEECARKASVYQGQVRDRLPAAEHLNTDHLDTLLQDRIPVELRALYLREYTDIRATLRSVAIASMSRKDFYDVAAQEELNEQRRLSTLLSYHVYFGQQLIKELPAEDKQRLATDKETFEAKKSEVTDRIRAEGGGEGGTQITDADMLRLAMINVDGVNSRGVSLATKTAS